MGDTDLPDLRDSGDVRPRPLLRRSQTRPQRIRSRSQVLIYQIHHHDVFLVYLFPSSSSSPPPLSLSPRIYSSNRQSVIVAGLVRVNVIHATSVWTTENIAIGVQVS